MSTITLSSINDINSYAESILEDISFLDNNRFVLNNDFHSEYKIVLKGEQFKGSINASVMESLLSLQHAFNKIYSLAKYGDSSCRRLTDEERADLEFIIKIEEGSSIINVETGDIIKMMIEKMSGKQVLTGLICVSSFFLIGAVGNTYIKAQKELKLEKIESIERQETIKALTESQAKTIEAMKEVIEITSETQRDMVSHLSRSGFEQVKIGNSTFTQEEIREELKNPRENVPSVDKRYTDNFYIRAIYPEREDTYADLFFEDSEEKIPHVALLDEIIREDDYQVIIDALKKEPIKLEVNCTYKKDKLERASLVRIIKDDEDSE